MSLKKGHKGSGTGKSVCAGLACSSGFSIVELMIAMVILLFVALAMMQTAMVTMDANARNVIRDEGTRLASDRLNELRYVPADDLFSVYDDSTGPEDRQIRNMTVQYTITNTVTTLATDKAVRLEVKVEWTWREQTFDASLSTIRGIN